ncbi:unnamed protein product, partial [Amoebophrya sp. A25]
YEDEQDVAHSVDRIPASLTKKFDDFLRHPCRRKDHEVFLGTYYQDKRSLDDLHKHLTNLAGGFQRSETYKNYRAENCGSTTFSRDSSTRTLENDIISRLRDQEMHRIKCLKTEMQSK